MTTQFREIDDAGISIEVNQLVVGAGIPFDVYMKDRGILTPLFPKGMVVSPDAKNGLLQKGISEVYARAEDSSAVAEYLARAKARKEKTSGDPSGLFRDYSFAKEQHHQIDRALLSPGREIPFSLLALDRFTLTSLVEAGEKSPALVTAEMLAAPGDLVIRKSDIPLYYEYINSLLNQDQAAEAAGGSVKVIAVKENSKIIVRDLLEDPRSGERIKQSGEMVRGMIDCVLDNRDALYDLLSLRGYDYYTYTHSVNVATLSIGIGAAIGMEKEKLEKLGIGALLHDIGKSAVSPEVLNKQGKLDQSEFLIIKSHVMEGKKILQEHHRIPEESFHAVLQHHEKLSGKGYPLQLAGNNITLFGRISAIADCYDALTTKRPYKTAFTPFYALSLIAKETGDYDPDLLREFVKMLGKL
ncbi:MAG: HD-GYP domain-containing protein [Alphaproteobacteria bacterium]|uniref:HD-GYP domain-containing protein n=1 Tax=Candidatus Nitrobium versatile TaxID=2884831 RepID=A0A953M363_9BACT|nr:HD-GYP domain-containing protein [Candidatus Nitrobium versatile]